MRFFHIRLKVIVIVTLKKLTLQRRYWNDVLVFFAATIRSCCALRGRLCTEGA